MRKAKKTIIFGFMMLFSLTLFLTACGKKKEEEVPSGNSEEIASEEAIKVVVPPVSSDGILYGVVLSVEKKSLVVQSDKGSRLKFSLDETVDKTGLTEELKEGLPLRIEYTGKIKNHSTKNVTVTGLFDSDKIPNLTREALFTASEILTAFLNRDSKKLSSLCDYPLIMDKGTSTSIDGETAFMALNKEELFSKDLVKAVTKTNLFMTREYSDGFLLGKSEPNLIVSHTKNGWKITAFHYK